MFSRVCIIAIIASTVVSVGAVRIAYIEGFENGRFASEVEAHEDSRERRRRGRERIAALNAKICDLRWQIRELERQNEELKASSQGTMLFLLSREGERQVLQAQLREKEAELARFQEIERKNGMADPATQDAEEGHRRGYFVGWLRG